MTEKKFIDYFYNEQDIDNAIEIEEIIKNAILEKNPEDIIYAKKLSVLVKYDKIISSFARYNKGFEEKTRQFADEIVDFVSIKTEGHSEKIFPMYLALSVATKGLSQTIEQYKKRMTGDINE